MSNLLGEAMNLHKIDISISSKHPIFFSHIIDNQRVPSVHSFHLHDYIEIYIYLSGDVDFIVEENYISLKRGDIIVTTPNVLHRPIIKSSKEYERFYIGIPLDAIELIDRGNNPLSFINKGKYIFSVSNNEFRQIESILSRISQILQGPKSSDTYLTYSYFLQFLGALNSALNTNKYDFEERNNDIPVLIKNILKYIDSNPTVSNVKELAEIFYVTPAYLSALFAESTHVNLKQYLTTKRIAEAKNLLSTDLSISDIALECRFSSCSHFISVFKHITGKTPREYRREIK